MDDGTRPRGRRPVITCESLRLDVKEAEAGRTWRLLPEGFRGQENGQTYPLPDATRELRRLAIITVPSKSFDSGAIYLRRATKHYQAIISKRQAAVLDLGRRQELVSQTQTNFKIQMKRLQEEAKKAVDEVRNSADQAAASLTELFELGRKGLDGQMQAHLEERTWKGERISASDFRQCFRMVSQAVKGLGLPSGEREKAREAIIEQAAAALKSTQEAVALAPGQDDGEVH